MGHLIAVYDKRNLFMTEKKIFDKPKLEVVTFETDVGKFGLMTCFDAMYEHPFLDLVEQEVGYRNAFIIASNAELLPQEHHKPCVPHSLAKHSSTSDRRWVSLRLAFKKCLCI